QSLVKDFVALAPDKAAAISYVVNNVDTSQDQAALIRDLKTRVTNKNFIFLHGSGSGGNPLFNSFAFHKLYQPVATAAADDFNHLEALRKSNKPIMLFTGEYDWWATGDLYRNSYRQRLSNREAGTNVVVIPNAAHLSDREQTDKVFSRVDHFVETSVNSGVPV